MHRKSVVNRGLSKNAKQTESDEDAILYGWPQIAKHLDCSVKTAHRMEQNEGLPILRPDKRCKGRVRALRKSLNAWMTGGVSSVDISGDTLLAFDRRTRLLWNHEFRKPLLNFRREEIEWRLRVLDLHGNEEPGVLFCARFKTLACPDVIYYFSPEGRIEWELEANPPLMDHKGGPFDRGWAFKHIAVTEKDKHWTVWAALGNDAGWAGCVLRIDEKGSASVQLANAGYVECLCPVPSPDGGSLIVCGENNDFDESFVALLGLQNPPSVSVPGDRLVYRFANAPTGQPRMYILFPKTELIEAFPRLYGHALHIVDYLDGLIIEVQTGDNGAHLRYHFSCDLEPRYVFPSGHHELFHEEMEKRGLIDHTMQECPELDAPLMLRIWEPDSGWYERPIHWRDNPWKELRQH